MSATALAGLIKRALPEERRAIAMNKHPNAREAGASWDHATHEEFYHYYAKESQSEATLQRFRGTQAAVLRVAKETGLTGPFDVADIGCGAGTQSRLWAALGHRVFGLDVSELLIRLAQQRASDAGLDLKFEVGAATALPWADRSMDICLLPELLEHVADWRSCLNEATRVLRPGGLLYVSTTNFLCPLQQEFTLPLYSWYPSTIKRYCERLAVTTRPQLAHHAKYPAVNWFSFYSLRDFLRRLGFRCLDRFDLIDTSTRGKTTQLLVRLARRLPYLRFLGHMATPGTYLVAVKYG
jgi:2-polyprenyl-3-methyl-5-hydroxy-6-metoxy-1,4-benzoquinol methylase